MYLADTDMCLCIDNEGRIQPSRCLCSKQGCRCGSQRKTALLDCAHVQGLKHQGFLLFSAFPKEMGRWRGGTHCAMVKMTLCVCFLQMHLFGHGDLGSLQSSSLKTCDGFEIWTNVDYLKTRTCEMSAPS